MKYLVLFACITFGELIWGVHHGDSGNAEVKYLPDDNKAAEKNAKPEFRNLNTRGDMEKAFDRTMCELTIGAQMALQGDADEVRKFAKGRIQRLFQKQRKLNGDGRNYEESVNSFSINYRTERPK